MKPNFDKSPLLPAIAQDLSTNEVLMLAYMNEEAWNLTIETGIAHYYSRSRKKIWKKGEQSGHIQKVKEIRIDCDLDTILLLVEQVGVACHEGYKSCFFRTFSKTADGNSFTINQKQIKNPNEIY